MGWQLEGLGKAQETSNCSMRKEGGHVGSLGCFGVFRARLQVLFLLEQIRLMFRGAGAPAGLKKLTFEHVFFFSMGVLVQGEVRTKKRKHWSMKEANRQCFT